MTNVGLVLTLLLLAYFGSFRNTTVERLPFGSSGLLFVAIGLALGPLGAGIFHSESLRLLGPAVEAAVGWFTLLLGLRASSWLLTGPGRVRMLQSALYGLLLTGACVCVFLLIGLRWSTWPEPLLVAMTAGVVCSQTSWHAVRALVRRDAARGPLTRALASLAAAGALLPLLLSAVPFSMRSATDLPGIGRGVVFTIVLGLVVGVVMALAVGRAMDGERIWPVVLSMTAVGVGLALHLQLSVAAVTLTAGLVLGSASPLRSELRKLLLSHQQAARLPLLAVAGASLGPPDPLLAIVAIYAGIVARVGSSAVLAVLGSATVKSLRRREAMLAVWWFPAGGTATIAAIPFTLHFPIEAAQPALIASIAVLIVGEFFGRRMVSVALERAGEREAGNRQVEADS